MAGMMLMVINRQWKIGLGVAIGLLATPVWLAAQVAITLTLPSTRALLHEDVIASVVIQNNSGQIIELDSDRGPFRFRLDVESKGGGIVARRVGAPLVSNTQMLPGESREFGFNLSRLFAIRSQGLYKISAGVDFRGKYYSTPTAMLEIVSGFELQRLTAGVPGDAYATRTYIISYLQRDAVENIYLQIEDADKTVYGVFNLGRIVRVRPTELKLDEAGNVHVLFQTVGLGFVHTAFTPFGVQLFVKTYAGNRGKASLVQQPNGQITVPELVEQAVPVITTTQEKETSNRPGKKTGSGGLFGQFIQQPASSREH